MKLKDIIILIVLLALIGGAVAHAGIVILMLILFGWIAFVALRWLFR